MDAFTLLFAESTARAVVAVKPEAMQLFTQACLANEVPVVALGSTGGESLTVTGRFSLELDELRTAHESTLPEALNA